MDLPGSGVADELDETAGRRTANQRIVYHDDTPLGDRSGTVEDHHLDDLPSAADLAEHAVLPVWLRVSGTHLSLSLFRGAGMADVGSPRVDGLLRPPRVAPSPA